MGKVKFAIESKRSVEPQKGGADCKYCNTSSTARDK